MLPQAIPTVKNSFQKEISPPFQSTSTLQDLCSMSSSSGTVIQCKQAINSKDILD